MAEEKKTSKKAEKADKPKETKKKKSRKNPFKSIASFFKSVKSEGKKVVWAKRRDVLRNTLVVIVCVVIAGIGIYAFDSLLSLGMKGFKNAADAITTTSASDVVEDGTEDTTDVAADDTAEAETTTETTTQAAE